MILKYRGNSYEKKPLYIETIESKMTLKYRGASYQLKHPVNFTASYPNAKLMFRGVAYAAGSNPKLPSTKVIDDSTNKNPSVTQKDLKVTEP